MRVWSLADPRLLINRHLLGEHREVHALLPQINGWRTHPEYSRFHNLHNYPEPTGHRYDELVYPPRTVVKRAWLVEGKDVLPRTKANSTNPTVISITDSSRQGISFLVLRHEMLRVAMQCRYPKHKHSKTQHPTPLPFHALLSTQHKRILAAYIRMCLADPHPVFKENTHSARFKKEMKTSKGVKMYGSKLAKLSLDFRYNMNLIRFPRTKLPLDKAFPATPNTFVLDPAYPGTGKLTANTPGADTPWDRDFPHSEFPLLEYLRIDWVRNIHHVNQRQALPPLQYTRRRTS